MKIMLTKYWKPLYCIIQICYFLLNTDINAQSIYDWKIEFRSDKGGGGNISTGTSEYVLKNNTIGKYIIYKSREYGINLVWNDIGGNGDGGNIQFESSDGSKILKEGQNVAILVGQGGYLYYKKRKYGINLEYSKTPIYEWQIRASSGSQADELQTNQQIGLYNTIAANYVIYCKREYGINLRWAKDCK